MSFRFPVKTQDPVNVHTNKEGYVRRVIREQWRFVAGTTIYNFAVPAGVRIRPTMLLIQFDVVQPTAAICFARVDFKSATPDNETGNWIWTTLLPSLDNRSVWNVITPAGSYGTYDTSKAYFGWTFRMNHIPMPEIFLLPFERVVVEVQGLAATDSMTIYFAYEEYPI